MSCAAMLNLHYTGTGSVMKPLKYNFFVHLPLDLIFEGCGWDIQCNAGDEQMIIIAITEGLDTPGQTLPPENKVTKLINNGKAMGRLDNWL